MTIRRLLCRLLPLAFLALTLSGCAETQLVSHYAKKLPWTGSQEVAGNYKVGKPYRVGSVWYYPQEDFRLVETGIASWYGPDFHGKKTANGEVYNQNELTAAHRSLQMPSLVRVTNLENGRAVVLRVNDRGPFKHGRIIDVSSRAADLLGFKGKGTARVRVEVLEKESRQIAMAAKRGMDTSRLSQADLARFDTASGSDMAPIVRTASAAGIREEVSYKPVGDESLPESLRTPTITVEELSSPGKPSRSVPAPQWPQWKAPEPLKSVAQKAPPRGHMDDGRFMPDAVVSYAPVRPTGLFVQAGSFAVYENAARLSANLSNIAPAQIEPVTVQGRQLYRVKLGPIASVAEADSVLNKVIRAGNGTAKVVRN